MLRLAMMAATTTSGYPVIRSYERAGLVPKPPRTPGNNRSYEAGHLSRLGFIRRARKLGFSLDQDRELLSTSDQKDRSCGQLNDIIRQCHWGHHLRMSHPRRARCAIAWTEAVLT
jgi:DNA-binding transcriptional MerR regulator